MARFEYIQNMESREYYAVEMDGSETVIRACGPLPWREMSNDPADFDLSYDDVDWINETSAYPEPNQWRLVSRTEADQIASNPQEYAGNLPGQ